MGGQAPITDTQEIYEREAFGAPRRNLEAIRSVQAAQAKQDKRIAEKTPLQRLAPGGTGFDLLDVAFSTPMRSNVIAKLEGGGEPVKNEQGRTIGVVYTNRFGGKEYAGSPDYNPIAAEIQRKSGTGDIEFKNVQRTAAGTYETIVQPLKPIEGTNIMQRAIIPTTTSSKSETSPVVTPEITPEVVPDDTSSLQLASAAQVRGRGPAARRATRGTRLAGAGRVDEGYGALLRGASPRSTV